MRINKLFKVFFLAIFVLGVIFCWRGYVFAQTGCFVTERQGVQRFPLCKYEDLRDSGYVMGSLPNPLDPSKCYHWGSGADTAGQEVDCSQAVYANAPNWQTVAPPPASLEGALRGAQQASTVTRIEYCNNLGAESSGSADSKERKVQDCIKQVNEEAYSLCIGNSNPGACAEAYRNGIHPSSKNNTQASGTPAVPRVTNAERDAITDCGANGAKSASECLKENPLIKWTNYIVNTLSIGIGIIVTIMIIIGGIQYASAGPNPQAVQSAKNKIKNALIALVAYFFLYAFVQYLIPGGVF